MEHTMTEQNQQPETHTDKPHDNTPESAADRPAVMNWIIVIIGILVLAQAIALGIFWLHL
jgi:flagellar basal body-associated protein FliL